MRDHRPCRVSAWPGDEGSFLRVEVALAQLKQLRLIIAFPDDSWVRPGAGDELIRRLPSYLPPLPIMLVSEGPYPRAYAAFQTCEFLKLLPTVGLQRFEIDLSQPPEDEEDDLPF